MVLGITNCQNILKEMSVQKRVSIKNILEKVFLPLEILNYFFLEIITQSEHGIFLVNLRSS